MAMQVGAAGADGNDPMIDINTTPLIDVMLVLLIMFIITIPIQTHAVKLDLPQNNPNSVPPEVDPVINRISVDFLNTIYWNDQQVSEAQLNNYLRAAASLNPQPELHLKPDALARYEVVDRIMANAQRAGIEKMGFVGNEAYAQ